MEGVNEKQVGGNHYVSMKVQPWDAMQACMTPEEFRGFLRGNVIRYAMRLGRKDSDDLGKLIHYAEKLRSLDEKAEPAPTVSAVVGTVPAGGLIPDDIQWKSNEEIGALVAKLTATELADWTPKGMCPCDACKLIRRERAERLAMGKKPTDGGAHGSTGASRPATP